MSSLDDGPELRDRHIGELMSQLASDMGTLVRQEMELLRAELAERMDVAREEMGHVAEMAQVETSRNLQQAKADLTRKGKKAGMGLGLFGAAGVASLLALGALTACLIILLSRWMDADLAALIVALVWGLVAGVAALRGRTEIHEVGAIDPGQYVPRQTVAAVRDDFRKVGDAKEQVLPTNTIETVKEDVEWAKTRGKSDRT